MRNNFPPAVRAAKFIAREKWLIAGDSNGCIHVYNYNEKQGVTSFDAHDGSIISLAVHPEQHFVLSTSHDDHLIKVWDWKKEWECTRVFEGHTNSVTQVKFDPENTDRFVSASLDGTVKVVLVLLYFFHL
jgi:coatomer subunit beta'